MPLGTRHHCVVAYLKKGGELLRRHSRELLRRQLAVAADFLKVAPCVY